MHGKIESSNIREISLPRSAANSTSTANLRHWFPWMVTVLVFAGSGAGTWHIYQAAESGLIAWGTYPLFALFIALVFTSYSMFFHEDEG